MNFAEIKFYSRGNLILNLSIMCGSAHMSFACTESISLVLMYFTLLYQFYQPVYI